MQKIIGVLIGTTNQKVMTNVGKIVEVSVDDDYVRLCFEEIDFGISAERVISSTMETNTINGFNILSFNTKSDIYYIANKEVTE